MTRNTFFAIAMMFAMATATANAQRFGNHGGRHEGGREMREGRNEGRMEGRHDMNRSESRMDGRREVNRSESRMEGRHEMNRNEGNGFRFERRNDSRNEGRHEMNRHEGNGFRFERQDVRSHANHSVRPVVPEHRFNGRFDHRGHVVGWEGRVRHENGRWGYYRDNRWYWYNRYFEPAFYFGHPIHHFNDYYYMPECGYIPGWEGRVCYDGGRWGYLRGNDWYWYDRYYEPDYYFAHPVHHFHHTHVGHVAHKVAAGVVGTIALGALISALCH